MDKPQNIKPEQKMKPSAANVKLPFSHTDNESTTNPSLSDTHDHILTHPLSFTNTHNISQIHHTHSYTLTQSQPNKSFFFNIFSNSSTDV